MQDKLHGNTALHWAILAQNHTAISTLIMQGASLDIANAQVSTCVVIPQVSIHMFSLTL
jgi:palmitoyltransferase